MIGEQFQETKKKNTSAALMSNQPIIILGFMGTGKTTLARELGRMLNCPAIDLDELITSYSGRTPNEIIEQDGDQEFRELETQMLREALEDAGACVIALGGGAWTMAANRQLIAEHGALTVWLDSSFELCWKRIEAGDEVRPLARSRERAERLYHERRPIYELARVKISVFESDNAAEIATKIIQDFSK